MSIDGWYKKVNDKWKPLGLGGEEITPTPYYVTTHDDIRDDGYFFDTPEEALAFYEETAAKGVIEYTMEGGYKRTEPCRVSLYNHRELIKIAYPVEPVDEPEEEFRPEDGAPLTPEEEMARRRNGKCFCNEVACHSASHGIADGCYEPPIGEWTPQSGEILPLCAGCYASANTEGDIPADEWTLYADEDQTRPRLN